MKVDLGGWGTHSEWITVNLDDGDIRAAPHHVADITAQAGQLDAFFAPESVDEMRCIHTLEHLEAWHIVPTLAYWRKFLKPAGRLLIVVPDLGALAQQYAAGDLPMETFSAVMYGRPDYTIRSDREKHRSGFDSRSLAKALFAAGFWGVELGSDADWVPSWPFDYPDLPAQGYGIANLRLWGIVKPDYQEVG